MKEETHVRKCASYQSHIWGCRRPRMWAESLERVEHSVWGQEATAGKDEEW